MKKNEMDKHSRELRREMLKYGLLIFIWSCFWVYQITRLASSSSLHDNAIWQTVFSLAVLIFLIALAGVKLYRQSISYIRWYQGVFNSMPVSVIVTDKDATWQQANEMARKTVRVKPGYGVEGLNSRHLIGTDGDIMKKLWIQGATEYRVAGNRLCVDGEDTGYIILFYNISELTGSGGVRAELINEVDRLLGRLSDAAVNFDGCTTSLTGYTIRQAGIICELSEVIMGIASGDINEPDKLYEKIGIVKAQMQQQAESTQLQIDNMRKTVGDLASTHDSINGILQNIASIP